VIAEGTIIVFSILLAFWIDAKWQDNLVKQAERDILRSLVIEMTVNEEKIEQQLAFRADQQKMIQTLFDASDNEINLSPDEVDRLIGDLTFWGRANFDTGAIDSLVDGGQLHVISNQQLRASLTALRSKYRFVDGMEKAEEEFERHYFDPFLMQNSFFPQIANAAHSEGGTVLVPSTDNYAKGPGIDHSYLLQDRHFLGLLVQERFNQEDAIYNLEELRTQIRELRSEIEDRLGQ